MKKILISVLLSAGLYAQSVTFTEKPGRLQFFARDAQDSAVVRATGTATGADTVSLRILRNGSAYAEMSQPVSGAFSLSVKIHAELASYRAEVLLGDSLVLSADSLLCGDAFMVDGQSNAEASEQGFASSWIRTFRTDSTWYNPRSTAWGIGRHLIEEEGIPYFEVNGAVGGSNIESHMPDTLTVNTIYGRIFWRLTRSGLRNRVRAAFWHQGEANGGDSLNATTQYVNNFRTMTNGWKRDFPGLEHIYVFQVHPGYCGGPYSDVQRETARRLPSVFDSLSVMSTAGIIQHDGCHFGSGGYQQMGDWMVRLVKRDLYGSADTFNIRAPDIQSARFLDGNRTRLLLQFDQAVVQPSDSIRDYFFFDRKGGGVDSVRADTAAHTVLLVLKSPSKALSLSYTPTNAYRPNYWDGTTWHMFPFEGPWLFNPRGVGALTFFGVPLPADSFLFLDTSYLDFYASDNGDPCVRLMNSGAAVPAVTTLPESSWLTVSVSGTGNGQMFHHSADLTGLPQDRLYSVKVSLSAAGYKERVYTVVVRPGGSTPASLKLDPPALFVFNGQSGGFDLKGLCANGSPSTTGLSADWTVSGGGTIDSAGRFTSNGETGVFDVHVALKSDTALKAAGTVTVDTAPVLPVLKRINFQTTTTPWKAGWLANNGTPYSTVDGMGWLTSVGSSYYAIFGSRDDRAGTNFLLKSFVWAVSGSPFHIDMPDNDYIVRVGLGDNTSGVNTVCQALVGSQVVCYKPAGTGNVVNTDTVTVTGGTGLNLDVQGAVNYLVVISKCGVDMDLVADDGMGPLGAENGVGANNYSPLQLYAAPNPFNPVSRIAVALPEALHTDLAVYDVTGRLVQTIFRGHLEKGNHGFIWNGNETASGIYLFKLTCGSRVLLHKAVLTR